MEVEHGRGEDARGRQLNAAAEPLAGLPGADSVIAELEAKTAEVVNAAGDKASDAKQAALEKMRAGELETAAGADSSRRAPRRPAGRGHGHRGPHGAGREGARELDAEEVNSKIMGQRKQTTCINVFTVQTKGY